jgi:hypothetical protein
MSNPIKYGDPLDLTQNELRNVIVHPLASAPSSPKMGQVFYNTTTNVLQVYNGTAFRPTDAAALADGSIQIAALAVNPLLRVNHTGTQPSSTISDLKTTVTGYTLDLFSSPVAAMNLGGQRLTNIAQASANTDSARWDQVIAYVTAAVQGQTAIKTPVRVYVAGTITLSGLQTVDGVSLNAGDRVAIGGMTTQNAIYVVASGAWTLAPDSTTGSQWTEGTEFLVSEGTTYTGAIFRQTTSGAITLGTNALAFTQTFKLNVYTGDSITTTITGSTIAVKNGYGLITSTGSLSVDTTVFVRKYSTTITGDGSTTTFTVTHGLGTTDVEVGSRDSNGARVELDHVPTTTTALTVSFTTAPTAGTTYRVTVQG